jgi:hypothetical protein
MIEGRATGVPTCARSGVPQLKRMRRLELWCVSGIGMVAGALEKCNFFLVRLTNAESLAA